MHDPRHACGHLERVRPGVTSLWLDHSAPITNDALPIPEDRLDVVIVGAGLTGLTTALLLARAGQRVAVVEAREVGAVTTGNTTAKLSLLQGTHLSRILRHQTHDVGMAYVEGNREAMQWLLAFCDEQGVAVQARAAATYAANESERAAAEEEHDAASSLGLPMEWHDRLDVPFPHVGATLIADQAQFDPMDVLAAMVSELRAAGGTLHQGQRVRGVARRGEPVVRLEGGQELRAEHVVLATGTPILDRGLYFAKVEAHRSYGLAFEGVTPPDAMFLSAGSDSRSVRGAPEGRLLVGGSGHVVGRTRSELTHVEALREWTATWFPGAVETHRWSAQDYRSHDGIPFIGALPRGGGRIHVATGYEKWGMTNAVVAARSISAGILGNDPKWSRTMGHRVTRPSGAAELVRTNLGVGASLATGVARAVRDRIPGTTTSPTAPACGVIGICTHLGGVLEWNDAEDSWDCPLHGSRFTAGGQVLEGPATRPLLRRGPSTPAD